MSRDGRLLAVGDGTAVRIWSTTSGSEERTISGLNGSAYVIVFSPDGSVLASGEVNTGYTIKLWDVSSGQEIRTLTGHHDNVYSLAFSPEGRYLASASGDRTVKLWDVESADVVHTFTGHVDRIYRVVFSPTEHGWLPGAQTAQSDYGIQNVGRSFRSFAASET